MPDDGSTPAPPQSPGIYVDFHGGGSKQDAAVPSALAANLSAPAVRAYQSPIRQHKRTPSQHREVKETLDARSEYTSDDADGRSHHRINQYTIKEEIGRGSYGAVHLAVDQFGNEFAVKEFSKTRLRKRAQSNILKGPRHAAQLPRRGVPFHSVIGSRLKDYRSAEAKDALYLIREEVAIMKKLNHPNLVQLIEVLDDPEEDSLYMVLEMCKKGVIMQVGLNQTAPPYSEESCRHWFRDLILGIEYLHAQGVVHRDIKPDNLLLTEDDVLKIVDFGVSEMFEKADNMRTSKSAGSPAFLPPELCVAGHGDVSGTAADIWSMGVSLYCLRYGRIPFDRSNPVEMYEAIKTESPRFEKDENQDFVDLMDRILEKDPTRRITLAEMRDHPWVTKCGSDPLLSVEENCAVIVEPPNDLEVNHAFTRRMSHLLCVMKAMSRFKSLLSSRSAPGTPGNLPDGQNTILQAEQKPAQSHLSGGQGSIEEAWASNSISMNQPQSNAEQAAALVAERNKLRVRGTIAAGTTEQSHGQAKPPPLLLGIGTGGHDDFSADMTPADAVSDSPVAADFDVYGRAYEAEMERINDQQEPRTRYLTSVVDKRSGFGNRRRMIDEASATGKSSNSCSPSPLPGVTASQSLYGAEMRDLVSRTIQDSRPSFDG